ncbi:recombinase RecT [Brevibacterium linens]|uniref:DNA single-strand annealing protein RecT-like protein n=1 Tax=Brevibacterium linens TaxID=1703 RepID=A0A0B9A1R4_BRELN|nr:recombinase RecT [Brevibacterium linens]KHS52584.1 DNA single-strand annealing protein RecT-like protein [Brevibacterium linens]
MSTELAITNPVAAMSIGEKQQYAELLAQASLLPKQYQRNPANVLLAMELGQSLSIPPIQAINEVHVIEGKPSASANLIGGLVRRAGHVLRIRVDRDAMQATAQIIRNDDPDYTFEVTWTMDDAKRAGSTNKDNWKKYPIAMLKARAITEVAREACPEALMGIAYTPDELGAVVDQDGNPVSVAANAAPMPRARTSKQREQANKPVTAQKQQTGRDWYAEAGECETADALAALYKECAASGELDDDLKSFLMTTGTALRQMEADQDTEVVDGQLIDNNGEIQGEVA